MKVCLGGTFNILHKGHKKLLDQAIKTAGEKGYIVIGLTTGDIIKTKKNVKPYEERKKTIEEYISKKNDKAKLKIMPIQSKYDPSIITDDYDGIIVSPETIITAEEINRERQKIGNKKLRIIKIKHVLAEDGKPISSTRIINKEIDENGNIL
jgi:pantetheine-phosphate adenylyltransferase